MPGRLVLLFILVPFIELMLLIRVGSYMGFWPTFIMLVILGLLGFVLARSQGFFVLHRIREELARGRLPGDALLDGLLVFSGGLLLITPGLLTDIAGLLLMVPQLRGRIRGILKIWLWNRLSSGAMRIYVRHR